MCSPWHDLESPGKFNVQRFSLLGGMLHVVLTAFEAMGALRHCLRGSTQLRMVGIGIAVAE